MGEKDSRTQEQVGMYDGIQRDLVKQDNYETAHQLAKEKLRETDFVQQCRRAGAEIIESSPEKTLARIKFINRDYLVEYPGGEIKFEDTGETPPLWERIIILHYLANARGASQTGELISYQQVPDGWLYYPNFVKRTTQILAKTFADDPEGFIQAGLAIGGKGSSLGKYALEIPALPKVSYHFVMWPGDDEFETEFNCVFDRSIIDYLPAEDITVLANMIAVKLIKQKK